MAARYASTVLGNRAWRSESRFRCSASAGRHRLRVWIALVLLAATGLPADASFDCYREIHPYYLGFDVPSMIHVTHPDSVDASRAFIADLLWKGAGFPTALPTSITSVHEPGGIPYPCTSVLDPPSIPGLALWLDGNDPATLILDGGRVAVWRDKSGQGRDATQTLPASQPLFEFEALNGQAALFFDGVDDFLRVEPPLDLSRLTVFLVTRTLDDTTLADQHAFATDPLDGGFACRIRPDMRPAFRVNIDSLTYDATDARAMTPATDVWVGTFDSTSVKLYRNGSQCGSRLAIGSLAPTGELRVGDGDQNPFHGYVAEVIVYDRALSQADLLAITESLSCKYDIPFEPPGWILALESPNLLGAQRLEISMDYGMRSYAYLLQPATSANRLVIFHQGHDEDILASGGRDVMRYFLDHGFAVLAFMMPLYGENPQWAYDVPAQAPVLHVAGHFQMDFYLSNDAGSYLRFFLDPVFIALNWAEANAPFSDVAMLGVSGGGWTTTLCAALDPRIRSSFPIAGSLPLYLTEGPCANGSQGDHEQRFPVELYDGRLSYLDLYILAAHGAGRQRAQVLNQFDPCCYGGINYQTYEDHVEAAVPQVGPGSHFVYLDTENAEHGVSLDVIHNFIYPAILGDWSTAHQPALADAPTLRSSPNPFRGTNTITYTVTPGSTDAASSVYLAVYDVRGRRVATLVDGRQGPGEYTQRWTGLDDRSMRLPAGVYWFNLRVGSKESRHRTILLR